MLAYVGRYTHRVAISPRRLLGLEVSAGTVCFDYKDYAHGARHRTMTLGLGEFVRRFALHVLPARMVKIRHYGLLANRGRQERLARVRAALVPAGQAQPQEVDWPMPKTGAREESAGVCPHCGARALVLVGIVPRPPARRVPVIDTS